MFIKSSMFLLVSYGMIALANTNSVTTNVEECPQICPALYSPLCASNGKIFKEFHNACLLKASNCRLERSALQKYVAMDMDFCTTELVTNLDNLLVKMDNIDITLPECIKPCTMIYSPVCMSNGKYRANISNKCVMDSFNCVLNKKGLGSFRVIQEGEC